MALPATLNPARPSGTDAVNDPASTIDNQIRDLKQLIADIFGIPVDPTSITAASFALTAAGIPSRVQPVSHRLSGILDQTATDVVVTGATEATLYTFSVPGGALGTGNILRLTVIFDGSTATTANTEVFRLKYGGTTMALSAVIALSGTGGYEGKVTAYIVGDGATNAQRALLDVRFRETAAATVFNYVDNGTAAIDSTVSQTLLLTSDGDDAGDNVTLRHALLELLV